MILDTAQHLKGQASSVWAVFPPLYHPYSSLPILGEGKDDLFK